MSIPALSIASLISGATIQFVTKAATELFPSNIKLYPDEENDPWPEWHFFSTALSDNILTSASIIACIFVRVMSQSLASFTTIAYEISPTLIAYSLILHGIRKILHLVLTNLENAQKCEGRSSTCLAKITSIFKNFVAPSDAVNSPIVSPVTITQSIKESINALAQAPYRKKTQLSHEMPVHAPKKKFTHLPKSLSLLSLGENVMGEIIRYCDKNTLLALRSTCTNLRHLSDKYMNKEVAVRQIFHNPTLYKRIEFVQLKENREIALHALTKHPEFIEDPETPESIKKNVEMIQTAFVAALLLHNEELAKRLLTQHPHVSQLLHDVLKYQDLLYIPVPESPLWSIRPFVLHAIAKSGHNLRHTSPKLQDNEDFVLEAAKQDLYAFSYASNRLKDDEAFISEMIEHNADVLYYASARIKDNEKIITQAIRKKWTSLRHASAKIQDNKTIILEAVRRNGAALKMASERLHDDEQVVCEAVKKNWRVYYLASEHVKNDLTIAMEAVSQNWMAIKEVGPELKNNKDLFLIAARQDEQALTYASPELQLTLSSDIKPSLQKKIQKIFDTCLSHLSTDCYSNMDPKRWIVGYIKSLFERSQAIQKHMFDNVQNIDQLKATVHHVYNTIISDLYASVRAMNLFNNFTPLTRVEESIEQIHNG